jgi:hypothetical protein
VRYSNTFTYSRFKRTQQLSSGPRLKDSMRQFMASLSVEAYDLQVIKPQAGEPLSAMLTGAQWGTAVTPVAGPAGGGSAGWGTGGGVQGVGSTGAAAGGGSARKAPGGQVGHGGRLLAAAWDLWRAHSNLSACAILRPVVP